MSGVISSGDGTGAVFVGSGVGVSVGVDAGVSVGVGVGVGVSVGDSVGDNIGVGSPVEVASGDVGSPVGRGTVVRGVVVSMVVATLVTVAGRVVGESVMVGFTVSSGVVSTGTGGVDTVVLVAVGTGVTPVGRTVVAGGFDGEPVGVGIVVTVPSVPAVVTGVTEGIWAKGTVSGVQEETGGFSGLAVGSDAVDRVVVDGTVERVVVVLVVAGAVVAGCSSGVSSPGVGTGGTTQSAAIGVGGEAALVFGASSDPVAFPALGRIVATANGRAGETKAAAKSTMQVTTPTVIRVLRVCSSCI